MKLPDGHVLKSNSSDRLLFGLTIEGWKGPAPAGGQADDSQRSVLTSDRNIYGVEAFASSADGRSSSWLNPGIFTTLPDDHLLSRALPTTYQLGTEYLVGYIDDDAMSKMGIDEERLIKFVYADEDLGVVVWAGVDNNGVFAEVEDINTQEAQDKLDYERQRTEERSKLLVEIENERR